MWFLSNSDVEVRPWKPERVKQIPQKRSTDVWEQLTGRMDRSALDSLRREQPRLPGHGTILQRVSFRSYLRRRQDSCDPSSMTGWYPRPSASGRR